ncbi:MAG: non-canonical purine NTP pyrophosphatase [Firmicutes bacterium]|uniref:dITP/XTP pyrophosphatase n=1 Tax=Sulfobacillus benefaciens TaxID=453960 RepID=A0A2T2WZV6_9FIRM|nr:non-canonical purine NTP pyrophosphatase [Bacillota bacterium]MCL5014163.1 non-canonical purine NTP pyrophosphatase [Bacillota bacterium]PSR27767.1 MAG: non-canonical purine NTP pyrophosphatase [Sulfobacillus benefaciens]HBQ93949.1 non-canonical purine NTP pyrophosphatase [Sulfobacillus sp.]
MEKVSLPIILASHNPGKLEEFGRLFASTDVRLELDDFSGREIIEETGTTYRENAELKAREVARRTGHWALADDSGVEVDALGGLPGVHSARFVSDDSWENSREILLRLLETPWVKRTASMRAVLCLASPRGLVFFSEGVVEGHILTWPRGQAGFGVDPIFSIDGETSFAEWSQELKDRVSHRGMAVQGIIPIIRQVMAL